MHCTFADLGSNKVSSYSSSSSTSLHICGTVKHRGQIFSREDIISGIFFRGKIFSRVQYIRENVLTRK